MLSATDQALIERVVSTNCHDSFGILVERYQSDLRYSLRQMTGWNEALADDLAQETFIQVFKSLKSYQGTAKFSSWLYRIAYNQMVSHFRLARNREVGASEELLASQLEQVDSSSTSELDLHRDLAEAMKALPTNQRMAIHLHLHRQLTHAEISTIMGIPLGTAKTLINRGKTTLRDLLSSWSPEDNL